MELLVFDSRQKKLLMGQRIKGGLFPLYLGGVVLMLFFQAGCQKKRQTTIDFGEGFEVIEVEDPDPIRDRLDKNLAKPCNPTGKKDLELKACLAATSRVYDQFDREAKAREPWYHFAEESWVSEPELNPQFIFPVVAISEAVAKLEKTPIVELNQPDVVRLTQKTEVFKDRKPYLVRGVGFDPNKGSFSVYQRQSQKALLVLHHTLSSEPIEDEKRIPLVLWLTQKPDDIFVDCQQTVP